MNKSPFPGSVPFVQRSSVPPYAPIEDNRHKDALLNLVLAIVAGTCFWFWQHSLLGGVFAAIVVSHLGNIGWVLEHGRR